MDIKSKLATIEVEGEEAAPDRFQNQQSNTNEAENMEVFQEGVDFAPSVVNIDVDSHIEEKLKPMLQTMLGRLESIEQNLQRNGTTNMTGLNVSNNGNNSIFNKSNSDSMYHQYHEINDLSNTSVLSTSDEKESQQLSGITALQAQIDELKAAMASMALSTNIYTPITDDRTVNHLTPSVEVSTGKHRREEVKAIPDSSVSISLNWNDAVQSSGNSQTHSDDFIKERRKKGGKWSMFFQDMNLNPPSIHSSSLKTSRSLDSHDISPSYLNASPVTRSDRLKTDSIEFNEQHFMHQSKQLSDDISVEPRQNIDKSTSRMNGMQIIEHVAYTIDKQPLHVTEKLFPPQSNQNGSRSTSGSRRGNHASEQLSKALGSFLDVISRCNETSTAAIDAVNSVDDAVLGLKSPVVPATRHIPITTSSSKSNDRMQLVVIDQDSLPMYSNKSNVDSTSKNRMNIDPSNYNSQSRDQYLITNQQPHRNTSSFNDTSNLKPSQANQIYVPEDNYHHQSNQYTLQQSVSLQSPNFAQNQNGSRQRKQQIPHYATSIKSKSISSPRIQHTMEAQYQQQYPQQPRRSSSPNRSRNSGFKSPMSTSLDPSGTGRLRNQSEWAHNKEALSTRKSAFAYSFPSDSKPRLSFEANASNSR